MALDAWTAFALATAALLAVPGPTVMLVVSYALADGPRSALATAPGVALGDLTAMTASLLGAGAVLAASATLFSMLKLAGAGYLVWLGVKMWRAPAEPGQVSDHVGGASRLKMFRDAYVVTALNPKSIVFFIAFVPQFVNPEAPALPQFVILEATFVALAAASVVVWAALAGQLRHRLRSRRALRRMNLTGGGFLIGAGVVAAASRS